MELRTISSKILAAKIQKQYLNIKRRQKKKYKKKSSEKIIKHENKKK